MKKRLLTIIGSISMAVAGIAAVVGGLSHKEVEATNATYSGSTLYIDIYKAKDVDTWKNGKLWMRYYDGATDGFKECEKIGNSGRYFKVTLIYCGYGSGGGFCLRCEGSGKDDWKETEWISWSEWEPQDYNGLKIVSQKDTSPTKWNVEKMKYTFKNVKEPENPSINTFRLFTRTGNNMDWWYSDQSEYCIRYTVSGVETIAKMNSVYNGNTKLYYWYADIPTNADGYQYVRVDGLGTEIYNYSVWTSSSNFASCIVDFVLDTKTGNDQNINRGAVDNCNADVAKKAVRNLLSCSNSSLNGYGAYNNLNTNFLSKLSNDDMATLRAASLDDYSYIDYVNAGNKYTTEMTKSTSYTYGQKIDQITTYSSAKSSQSIGLVNFNNDSNVPFIIIIVSLAGLTAIGGYFFYKKRREN